MTIQVLLADDHLMFREGLRALLAKQGDMRVVAEASDGRTAVRLARKLRPTVVVMDVTMPGLNGIEAMRQIAAAAGGVKVVALSMHADKRFVVEAFRAGAVGYILKDGAFEELAHAIRIAISGKSYLSPAISDTVIRECVSRSRSGRSSAFGVLTERERQVLQLLAEGKTTKQAAADLGVSVKTVETHRTHIMDKLGVHSIAELTKYAIREGLTPP